MKKLRKVCSVLLWAVCFVLQAALLLWGWPILLQDWLSGNAERREVSRREYFRRHKHRIFDELIRRKNEKRHKRVWKNRNNFYK